MSFCVPIMNCYESCIEQKGSVTAMMRAIEMTGLIPALISSTKGKTGHECWMAGASELVYCTLMMQHGFVAPNVNFKNPDEDTAALNLATQTVEMPLQYILSNSFGFGGTNSAVVLKKM